MTDLASFTHTILAVAAILASGFAVATMVGCYQHEREHGAEVDGAVADAAAMGVVAMAFATPVLVVGLAPIGVLAMAVGYLAGWVT